MALFLLRIPKGELIGTIDGLETMVVEAPTAALAAELASLKHDGDGPWSDTRIDASEIETTGLADFEGWVFSVTVSDGPTPTAAGAALGLPVTFSYTGEASDTIEDVGDALAAAGIAAGLDSSYDDSTFVLEVTSTTDDVGDKSLAVSVIPPDCIRGDVGISSGAIVASTTQLGATSAATEVEFQDMSTVIPGILFAY